MWPELGIAATTDQKEIRRAYAARLRASDPDKDPAAFMRLRNAYEAALRYAERAQAGAEPDEEDQDHVSDVHEYEYDEDAAPSAHVQRIETAERPIDPEQDAFHALIEEMREAVRSRRYDDALATYRRGLAQGALPFGFEQAPLEEIMVAIVQDLDLPASEFARHAQMVGWAAAPAALDQVSPLRRAVLERLAADAWFQRLEDLATGAPMPAPKSSGWFPLGYWRQLRIERRSAALFFGKRIWYLPRKVAAQLARDWRQYNLHAAWLKGRIDPDHVARFDRLLERGVWPVWLKEGLNFLFVWGLLVWIARWPMAVTAGGLAFGTALRFGWTWYRRRADAQG
jgi:hypothetical protein